MFGIKSDKEGVMDKEIKMDEISEEAKAAINELKAPALPNDFVGGAVEEIPPLTYKEDKALKRAGYNAKKDSFNKAFLIKNKKTKQIVEINAASAVQAANFIGWRPRQVILLEEKHIKTTTTGDEVRGDVETSTLSSISPEEIKADHEKCPGLK